MRQPQAANNRSDGLHAAVIDRHLREALAARAEQLGLDPRTIVSPGPGALVARAVDGALLRVDFRAYGSAELER